MDIKIIVVGKTKTSHWHEAELEYLKRLQPFANVSSVILKARSTDSSQSVPTIIEQEGRDLLEKIGEKDFVMALTEEAKTQTSEAFAEQLHKWHELYGAITIIVGGTFGLSKEIKNRANAQLSMSPMTFTHEMVRPILLEQLYRAFMINANRSYHY